MSKRTFCQVTGYQLEPVEGYRLPNGAHVEYRLRTVEYSDTFETTIAVYLTAHDAVVGTATANGREESRRRALASVPEIVRKELAGREQKAAADPLYAAAKGIYPAQR